MKRYSALAFALLLAIWSLWEGVRPHTPAQNPDPNHTHADFAVWVDGMQLDFSDKRYMSGSSKDEPEGEHEDSDHKHPYLHLHDGNGNVIHLHKPGLALGEFFASINVGFSDKNCVIDTSLSKAARMMCGKRKFRMFVNGKEVPFDLKYVFADGDKILFTDAADDAQVQRELKKMTDDACRYSQTCPWRGKPPPENCVSDPTVPCTID